MGVACSNPTVPKKVLLIGPSKSGKTTLLYAWCANLNIDPEPTESFNVEMVTGSRQGHCLLVWDVSDSSSRRRQFYHGTDAIVYMIDNEDVEVKTKLKDDLTDVTTNIDLKDLPLVLVLNKYKDQGSEDLQQQLDLAGLFGQRPYTCVGVTKDDPASYQQALDKLCDMLYPC